MRRLCTSFMCVIQDRASRDDLFESFVFLSLFEERRNFRTQGRTIFALLLSDTVNIGCQLIDKLLEASFYQEGVCRTRHDFLRSGCIIGRFTSCVQNIKMRNRALQSYQILALTLKRPVQQAKAYSRLGKVAQSRSQFLNIKIFVIHDALRTINRPKL